MTTFELALAAAIPVIGVHSDDPVHFEEVVQSIASVKCLRLHDKWKNTVAANSLWWTDDASEVTVELYKYFRTHSKQLIVLNPPPELNPLILDTGPLPIPQRLVSLLVLDDVVEREKQPEILAAIKGLSIKAVSDLVALTTARTGEITPKEIRRTRTMISGSTPGLSVVDTTYDFYVWPEKLHDWIQLNKPYFMGAYNQHLVPRGILLEGEPGVGKSMAAKVIANEFSVPLYRLDIASTLGKYVGESEARLSRLLVVVEREAPCVLLIDEVEKIFSTKDDAGVTSRILSQLLWWLAEHQSRVFVVMTTNESKVIPKELYRSGRIDMAMEIPKLSLGEAGEFSKQVYASVLGIVPVAHYPMLVSALKQAGKDTFSHAEVREIVYNFIKEKDLAPQLS